MREIANEVREIANVGEKVRRIRSNLVFKRCVKTHFFTFAYVMKEGERERGRTELISHRWNAYEYHLLVRKKFSSKMEEGERDCERG